MVNPFTKDHEQDEKIKPVKDNWAVGCVENLIHESLDTIKVNQNTIAVFASAKERVKDSQIIDYINYYITLCRYEIEDNYADITKYREWKKEFSRV